MSGAAPGYAPAMALTSLFPALPLSTTAEKTGWKVVSTLSAVAGGIATRKAVEAVWSAMSSSDVDPPLNPADRRIGWKSALQWAVAAGVGAGIGRMVSQRAAAAGWERATGSTPPGIAA